MAQSGHDQAQLACPLWSESGPRRVRSWKRRNVRHESFAGTNVHDAWFASKESEEAKAPLNVRRAPGSGGEADNAALLRFATCDISRRSRRHANSITSPARLTGWSGFDCWSGAVWCWCVRRTQCRVIVGLGDRWRHRIGRFCFERSGVKCCSKKPDRNLLTHRRSLRQASSRMAALKRGEDKTEGSQAEFPRWLKLRRLSFGKRTSVGSTGRQGAHAVNSSRVCTCAR